MSCQVPVSLSLTALISLIYSRIILGKYAHCSSDKAFLCYQSSTKTEYCTCIHQVVRASSDVTQWASGIVGNVGFKEQPTSLALHSYVAYRTHYGLQLFNHNQ